MYVEIQTPSSSGCDSVWKQGLAEAIGVKWSHQDGPYTSMTGVLIKKENLDRVTQRMSGDDEVSEQSGVSTAPLTASPNQTLFLVFPHTA